MPKLISIFLVISISIVLLMTTFSSLQIECNRCTGSGDKQITKKCGNCGGDGKLKCRYKREYEFKAFIFSGYECVGKCVKGQIWDTYLDKWLRDGFLGDEGSIITCPNCEGEGNTECYECDGRGKLSSKSSCSKCDGKGTVGFLSQFSFD